MNNEGCDNGEVKMRGEKMKLPRTKCPCCGYKKAVINHKKKTIRCKKCDDRKDC